MKNFLVAIVAILFVFSLLNVPQVKADDEVPKSAQQFADKNFKSIVLDHVNSEDSQYYNLSSSENLEFSKLYRVSVLSKEFVTTDNEISENHKGIVPGNEWISVVYQDEKPVNVIGTFKKEDGSFELSTFGYGQDLATAIDMKKTMGGKLIYELPTDSWFLFENGKVSAVNKAAQSILDTSISLGEFRKFVYERYENREVIIENGEVVTVGGNHAVAYESNETSYTLFYLVGLGVFLLLMVVFIKYRNRTQRKFF